MLHTPSREYKTSTETVEYQNLHKKDDELIGDNIENEEIVEYGVDFINCKIIHDTDST